VTAAVRVPVAAGLKVTLMVQLAPAATLDPQLFVSAKSLELAPESAMLLRLKSAFPELVKVTTWAAVAVPTAWLAKARLVGERLVVGELAAPLKFAPPPPPQDVANIAIATQTEMTIIAGPHINSSFSSFMKPNSSISLNQISDITNNYLWY
jgi:hypothetical protein